MKATHLAVIKRLLNVVAVLLLIAAIVPFAIYAYPPAVGADHSFVVLTASMEPEISPGDVVIVDERPPSTIESGDVVTFMRGDAETPVTHRVVEVNEGGSDRSFVTKGDANEDPDQSPVPEAQVIGTVMLVIPYLGYVIQFANSNYGFAALVVLPIVLFILNEIWMFVGGIRRKSEDPDPETIDHTTSGAVEHVSTEEGASSEVSITATDLNFSIVVLLGFAVYGIYTAYLMQTALSISVAFGVTSMLLLTVGLRLVLSLKSAGPRTSVAIESSNRDLDEFIYADPSPDEPRSTDDADSEPISSSTREGAEPSDISADGGEVDSE